MRPSLDALLGALSDRQLTADEQQQLEQLLGDDPQARTAYLDFMELHALLCLKHPAPAESEPQPERLAVPSATSRGPRVVTSLVNWVSQPVRFGICVAALTVVSLVLTAAQIPLWRQPPAKPSGSVAKARPDAAVAQLVQTHDVQWAGPGPVPPTGEPLRAGRRLQLERGLVRVAFRSGAEVVVEGPAVFLVESSDATQLQRGRLVASVPPQAAGFTVDTPSGAIVDLGTKFGVEVAEQGRCEIHVLTGQVQFLPRGALLEREPLTLNSGSAVVFRHGKLVSRGAVEPDKFAAQVPRTATLDLMPPLKKVGNRHFARLQITGAGEAFTDHQAHQHDEPFPVSLRKSANQYMWFDLSSRLSLIPTNARIESARLTWRGWIRPQTFFQTPTVASRLGIFPVPDAQRGVPTVFARGDGKDLVRYYETHRQEVVDSTRVPAVSEQRPLVVEWDVTELVQQWQANPQQPQRGQFMILNDQHPLWIVWQDPQPRLEVTLSIESEGEGIISREHYPMTRSSAPVSVDPRD